jgi:hypothetical protein
MSNYSIYKIYCEDCEEFYIGSTKAFRARKSQHKTNCNNNSEANKKYNIRIYKIIRENGGWDNWKMICIEECDETIITKRQAEAKEEEWRIKLNSTLNSKKAFRTKEEKLEYDKKFRQKQFEEYKEFHKKEQIDTSDKWNIKKEFQKVAEKKWAEKNKDSKNKKLRIWKEENKDKLCQVIECKCGGSYQYQGQSRHFKTKTHLNYEKSISPER